MTTLLNNNLRNHPNTNMTTYTRLANTNRSYEPIDTQDTKPVSLTNEETENLAGMVANRRALFEKSNPDRHLKLTKPITQKSVNKPSSVYSNLGVNKLSNLLSQTSQENKLSISGIPIKDE